MESYGYSVGSPFHQDLMSNGGQLSNNNNNPNNNQNTMTTTNTNVTTNGGISNSNSNSSSSNSNSNSNSSLLGGHDQGLSPPYSNQSPHSVQSNLALSPHAYLGNKFNYNLLLVVYFVK